MPDTATAPTMTAAQLRAAGTRLLGFYLGGGGAKVDALADPAHLVTRDADGKVTVGPAGSNYMFSAAAVNPARGIIADFANNAGAGLNGAMISFTQNTINNWCIGQAPGVDEFAIYQGRNGVTDGSRLLRLHAGLVRFHARSGPQADPSKLQLDETYANTATPSNQQLKFELLYASATEAYGWALDNIGRMWHHSGNSAGATGGHVFATADVGRWQIVAAGHLQPFADNAYALGGPSNRGTTAYFTTGSINTCDVRFKTFRTDRHLRAAEHVAALALFDAFGFYQFNDAIETKGEDGARWHFGPAAQEAYSIWADHGLCAPLVENDKGDLIPPPGAVPPAFMCFDLIEEETAPVTEGWRPSAVLGTDGQPVMVKCAEGEEATEQRPTGETIVTREAGHIFGVRIDQLHSIMLAALNAERKAMAAWIAALEGAA